MFASLAHTLWHACLLQSLGNSSSGGGGVGSVPAHVEGMGGAVAEAAALCRFRISPYAATYTNVVDSRARYSSNITVGIG